jgi:putative FmdB family regulatory protein
VPTYQYACTACDHRFEEVQSFTDPSLTECPECGGRLRKLYGSVGVVFKGSGFYRTDSRKAGPSEKKEKKEPAKAGSSGSSGSSDSSGSSGSSTGSKSNSPSSTTGTTTPTRAAS